MFYTTGTEADQPGLDVLTEVVNAEERDSALRLGARIIGVNHRDLHDQSFDLGRSVARADAISNDRVVVAEPGITLNRVVRNIGRHVNGSWWTRS